MTVLEERISPLKKKNFENHSFFFFMCVAGRCHNFMKMSGKTRQQKYSIALVL